MLGRKLKFKTYLIQNIPEKEWKKFKIWSAINKYNNLQEAFSDIIKNAGNNKMTFQGLRNDNRET